MAHLDVYRRYVNEIKQYAAENGMSATETNKIFERCFRTLDLKFTTKTLVIKKPFRIFKHLFTAIFALFLCTLVLYNHPTTHTFVLRNLQNFIYPGLKVFRKFAVPIVKRYPSLTGTRLSTYFLFSLIHTIKAYTSTKPYYTETYV